MKFVKAKKDGIKCHDCETFILRGEDMLLNFPSSKNPKSNTTVMIFHPECYKIWYINMVDRKWMEWRTGLKGNPPRPKLGRPVLDKQAPVGVKLHRLVAARSYNKKIGNEAKVKILTDRIAKLKNP